MVDVTTDEYFPGVTLSITNSQGQPAAVDGAPVWASSDDTVLSVEAQPDGMGAVVRTVAPGGPARISVTADADLGAGTQTITGVTEDINVTLGASHMASVMTLSLGAPTAKV
jgi:hypothetical protein